ncbi:MAG: DEAD/DEAH box helicase [Bacteroidetes bacterium]|nr:DEAD/DEAH box helicase [Bacteroidota bacterium]
MTFEDLNLNKPLLNALADLKYTKPTTIQHKAFPVVMSGRDVVGIAQTGTGKTLSYLLPALRQWEFSKDAVPRILVMVPTRELVTQVVETAELLSKYMSVKVVGVYGGTNIKTQMAALYGGADIVVGTPGRIFDLALNGSLKMKSIKKLVIDEVDEMLSLGFRYQLTNILTLLPQKRQNLMFSATLTDEVEALINDFFNAPEKIEAAPAGSPLENITQTAYEVPNFNTKINLLDMLLSSDAEMKKVLVFTATKKMADDVYELIAPKFEGKIGVIHSNKSQNNRFDTVEKFQDGSYRALIATDIIARGLDISEVSHVINFDVPDVPESYIHRIGRTGRADKKGISITFASPREDEFRTAIESLMKFKIPVIPNPEGLEISDVLTRDEMPNNETRNIQDKFKIPELGVAFHEKKAKNKKVNMHMTRAEKLKLKYGKPKKRKPKK